MFDCLPNSENGRFGRFGRLAEPSAPTGGRFGRLWRDSRFHLLISESEANSLVLLPFSEFGRFGITNQMRPILSEKICKPLYEKGTVEMQLSWPKTIKPVSKG